MSWLYPHYPQEEPAGAFQARAARPGNGEGSNGHFISRIRNDTRPEGRAEAYARKLSVLGAWEVVK